MLLVSKMEKTFDFAFSLQFTPSELDTARQSFSALEVLRKSIRLDRIIGQGQSGIIHLGVVHAKAPVAIKTVRAADSVTVGNVAALAAAEEALQLEARLLHQLKHPHIVRVLAIVTRSLPTWVCLEYMPGGDLKTYLRACRPALRVRRQEVSSTDFASVLAQVAQALAYLEQHRVVHRDVAARNVLVGESLATVKLSDLGATRVLDERDYYRKSTDALVPLKWMAPEAIREAKYTCKSDVWSFGVLAYEVASLGMTPYGNLSGTDLMAELERGYRLPQPLGCPDSL